MTIRNTSLDDLIRLGVDARLMQARTQIPGTVEKIDLAANTVEVRIDVLDVVELQDSTKDDGSPLHYQSAELPNLQEVPIGVYRSAGHMIALPMAVGDRVLIVFCDRDISTWWKNDTGSPIVPDDVGSHKLAGAVAVPMLYPASEALADLSATKIRLGADGGSWEPLALGNKTTTALNVLKDKTANLQSILTSWTPIAMDGGASLKAVVTAWAAAAISLASILSSDVEAT